MYVFCEMLAFMLSVTVIILDSWLVEMPATLRKSELNSKSVYPCLSFSIPRKLHEHVVRHFNRSMHSSKWRAEKQGKSYRY